MRWLLFLLFLSPIFGDEDFPFEASMPPFELDPSASVFNSVNVTTGNYFEEHQDLSLNSPIPIPLNRTHFSSDLEYHPGLFRFQEERVRTYIGRRGSSNKIWWKEPSGGAVLFHANQKCGYHHGDKRKWRASLVLPAGYSNTFGGEMGGKTHLRNTSLTFKRKEGYLFELVKGDGERRTYRLQGKKAHWFLAKYGRNREPVSEEFALSEVTLANGNRLSYTYDWVGRLVHIKALGREGEAVAGWVHFYYPNETSWDVKSITTSDGQSVEYCFDTKKGAATKHKRQNLLTSLSINGLAQENYTYDNHRIIQQKGPLGESLSIHYLDDHKSSLRHHDSNCFRVAYQTASVGENGEEGVVARFSYDFGDSSWNQYGWTDVYDAYDNLTRYHYDVDKRINLIEKFQNEKGSQTLVERECFFWWGGNLTQHCHTDPNHQVLYCREFEYDERENITTESFVGNLSGECGGVSTCLPYYSSDQRKGKKRWKKIHKGITHPEEIEKFQIFRTYSDDGFNTLLTEEDGDKRIVYTYLQNTDLVTSKTTYIEGNLCEEETFAYDLFGQLIFYKFFDGFRTFCKEVSPRTSEPGFGLPEGVEEYALEGGSKLFIKTEYLHYSKENRVIQRDILDGEGQMRYSIHYDYDGAGRLIAETDPLGQKTTYTYDESGNLILTETPTKTTYTKYDQASRPIKTETSDRFGSTLTQATCYDFKGNPVSETDESGNVTSTEYDREGRPIHISYPPLLQGGCWVHPEKYYRYDPLGNLVAETDEQGFEILHTYNHRGQKIKTQYPDGTGEKWVYSIGGFLKRHTDRTDLSTHYIRDFKDRPLQVSIYSPEGELLKVTHHTYEGDCLKETIYPDGTRRHFTYNAKGQLILEDHEGAITLYEYDPLGRQTKKVEGDQITCWEYDPLDRKVREEICDIEGNSLIWQTFGYDFDGNQIFHSEGGAETKTLFGLLGPIKIYDPLGHETTLSYQLDYPLQGLNVRQTVTTDPLGNQTITTFDPRSNLHTLEKRDKRGQLIAETSYAYDLAGHKVEECHQRLSNHGKSPYRLAFSYDSMGRLLSRTEEGEGESRTTAYVYDRWGRLITTLKPSGIALDRTYDPLGRLRTQSGPDFSDTYTYDLMDHLLEVKSADGSQTLRTYDRRGFLTAEKLANGHTLHFRRTLEGKIAALELPDGSLVSYTYKGPQIKTLTRGSYTFSYQYDAQGKLIQFDSPIHSLRTDRDLLGRPLRVESPLFSEQLTYDPAGNLLTLSERDPVGSFTHVFTYDDLYQLASQDGANLACDSLGNRLSDTCDGFNQLIASKGTTLTYDADGCPLTQGPFQYTYDSQGRLIVVESDTFKTTFTYDPFHRRLTKTLRTGSWWGWNEISTSYLYAAEDEIGAFVDGQLVEFRPLGPGLGAEIGAAPLIELQGTPYFPLYDFRGSVRLLLDQSGRFCEAIRYNAFGESKIYNSWGFEAYSSLLSDSYQFLSKRKDEESGLIFFGRRYYQPALGRWLTPDPKGYEEGPHLYRYCNNRPLTQIDLRGLEAKRGGVSWLSRYVDHGLGQRSSPHYASRESYASAIHSRYHHDRFYRNKTGTYSLHRDPFPHGGKVMMINGMNTSLDEARSNAEYLSKVIGGYDVTYVYNPTAGIVKDILRARMELGSGMASAVVDHIHKEWDAFFDSAPSWMTCLVYAHSEGGIILRNALMSYDEERRNRVIPILIAPAAYVWKDLNAHSWHYRSDHDFVPLIDLTGLLRCRENTTVLSRAEGAPRWDHSLQSNTYREPINDSSKRYGLSIDIKLW